MISEIMRFFALFLSYIPIRERIVKVLSDLREFRKF